MDKELAVRILNSEVPATAEQMAEAISMAVRAFCGAKPMVRCIDCKWWEPTPDNTMLPDWHRCRWFNMSHTRDDDFCSRAERRI